jgi:hypothetical protein
MRARGLKQIINCVKFGVDESRPMRARGLKPYIEVGVEQRNNVAPHAGAWIET